MPESIPFNTHAIAPLAILGESWERVRGQYWIFLGVTVVGLLIASFVPMAVMLGPMMVGIYLCYRNLARGLPVTFEVLFKGFDRFLDSFIAALLMLAASLVVLFPLTFLMVIGGVLLSAFSASHAPEGAAAVLLFLLFAAGFLVFLLASVLINLLFAFTFPLIADRRLPGLEAVKLSLRAARANFWGLLGLGLAIAVLSLAGLCFCYIGAFLVMPISFGAHWIAYERVFGLAEAESQV